MSYFHCYARDPWSSFTHYIGMCAAAIGSLLFLLRGRINGAAPENMAAAAVFGLSLVMLYAASAVYHFYRGSERVLLRLRKLDHSIIYVLIAGSYTPIVLHCMARERAVIFLAAIWSFAAIGIIAKLCWLNAPRWLYTSIYLIMGWAVLFDWSAFASMESGCLRLVALGGIFYSIGAVFYIAKRPFGKNGFGFHEIFHILILLGSLAHYLAVFFYIL